MYPPLIRTIKGQIIGEAREILIASANPNNWIEIKDVLLHSYGDKRDLASHIQSLFYITLEKNYINHLLAPCYTVQYKGSTTRCQPKPRIIESIAHVRVLYALNNPLQCQTTFLLHLFQGNQSVWRGQCEHQSTVKTMQKLPSPSSQGQCRQSLLPRRKTPC